MRAVRLSELRQVVGKCSDASSTFYWLNRENVVASAQWKVAPAKNGTICSCSLTLDDGQVIELKAVTVGGGASVELLAASLTKFTHVEVLAMRGQVRLFPKEGRHVTVEPKFNPAPTPLNGRDIVVSGFAILLLSKQP